MNSYTINNETVNASVRFLSPSEIEIVLGKEVFKFSKIGVEGKVLILKNGDHIYKVPFNGEHLIAPTGVDIRITPNQPLRKRGGKSKKGAMNSPMPGKVFKILVKVGDVVKAGQKLAIIEAMKMEHGIEASHDGVIEEIFYSEGEAIQSGEAILKLGARDES